MRSIPFTLALLGIGMAASAHAAKPATPEAISCPKPRWPHEAWTKGQQGTVKVGFQVSLDGMVRFTRTRQSSGFPMLDYASEAAIRECRFRPPASAAAATEWHEMEYVWMRTQSTADEDAAAFKALQDMAGKGNHEARLQVAIAYMTGIEGTVGKDEAQARQLMLDLAQLGYAPAQFMLSNLLWERKENADAEHWLRTAALQGLPDAQFLLAVMGLDGKLAREVPRAEAITLLRHAARGGNMAPLTAAAFLMLESDKDEEMAEAVELLQLAAEKDEPNALFYLGRVEAEAEDGPNLPAARRYFERAAEHGSSDAKEALRKLDAGAATK